MTYSVVARDEVTGQLGVAIQSHVLAVGASCPRVEPGVGAVVTQAFMEPAYGPRTIAKLREGMAPEVALADQLAEDTLSVTRQVAVVDARGRVAVHTGKNCIRGAGHATGAGFSCQANMTRVDGVPEAMAEGFGVDGDLATRLLAALDAGEAAGGDIRGRQSAALVVVSADPHGPMGGRMFDLRVDDHAEPLVELRRLAALQRAYMTGNGDMVASLARGNPEGWFWPAIGLIGKGELDAAREKLEQVYAVDDGWREFVRRLTITGMVPGDPAVLAKLTED